MKRAMRFPDIRLKALLLFWAASFTGAALANPVGPAVVAGGAMFNSTGNTLTVTNTPGAIINWQGFSIGRGELTRFIQQSAGSTVLNRVTGGDPSAILGALQSNGRVFLINPNGIAFGQGARIDVAGLAASTLNMTDADFLAGRLNFGERAGAGSIVNAGEIHAAPGGQVLLVAPTVENSGVIAAPNGDILLAAGRSVRLIDIANPEIQYEVSAPANAVANLGSLAARQVGLFGGAIRHAGSVSATAAETDATGRVFFRAEQDVTLEAGSRVEANGAGGGEVTIQSLAGNATVGGAVEAVGNASRGGKIEVLGERVAVMDQGRIDASGFSGGGSVLVGGDFQGSNPAVQNARETYVGAGALLHADAISAGAGGKVVVWAADTTQAYGDISARGGAKAGDGGFVEVSGKQRLDFAAGVDTRAPAGQAGTLLLDPTDITIVAEPTSSPSSPPPVCSVSCFFSVGSYHVGPAARSGTGGAPAVLTDSVITWTTIYSALASNGNVVIETASSGTGTGTITVADPGTPSGGSLWLLAQSNLFVNAGISMSGSLKLVAGWDGNLSSPDTVLGAGSLIINKVGVNSGGTLYASAGSHILINGGSLTTGGDAFLKAGQDIRITDGAAYANSTLSADAGADIRITASSNNAILGATDYVTLNMEKGKLYISGTTPYSASVATTFSPSVISLLLNFPSLASGGYVINGVEGGATTAAPTSPATGLLLGGSAGVIGKGLKIDYGGSASPPSFDPCIANPLLPGCSAGLPPSVTNPAFLQLTRDMGGTDQHFSQGDQPPSQGPRYFSQGSGVGGQQPEEFRTLSELPDCTP